MSTPPTRMPAEWEPHAATWIAWPHNPADWPGKFQPIPRVFAEIVRHLSRVERVHILVNDLAAQRRATSILSRGGANLARVHFHHWPTDRVWLRDSGPIFVKIAKPAQRSAASLAVTNWKFNAWAKYSNFRRDDQIPHRVAQLYNLPEIKPEFDRGRQAKPHRLVLEGGSIDINGAGVLLTTEECLLSEVQQRNPGLGDETTTQRCSKRAFRDYLGIHQTLWLPRGCAGDDTHGHIDDVARFVAARHHPRLRRAQPRRPEPPPARREPRPPPLLPPRSWTASPSASSPSPCPRPSSSMAGASPPATPTSTSPTPSSSSPPSTTPTTAIALNIIAACFPTRQVVGIHSVDLVWGLGALHCLTQQQPA